MYVFLTERLQDQVRQKPLSQMAPLTNTYVWVVIDQKLEFVPQTFKKKLYCLLHKL